MSREKSIIISAICLSISILIGSLIISQGLNESSMNIGNNLINAKSNIVFPQQETNVMTLELAAYYIGISNEQLKHLTESGSGIPYIIVEGKYIFTKKGIDEWLLKTQGKFN